MKINSKEARAEIDANNYVIFRNYAPTPDASLFREAFGAKKELLDSDGFDYGPMKIMPDRFFEEKSVYDFYNECVEVFGEKTTPLIIEGNAKGKGTDRHHDLADVIHWQCNGESEWIFYDIPEPGAETKIQLSDGDVIWFKKHNDHSVENIRDKYSIIVMSTNILKDFLVKKYAEAGREFK
jgi:hypothetical protein